MEIPDLLVELFDRIPPLVADAVDGLDAEQLAWTPADGANSIGWLTWHLVRVQDSHIAELIPGEGQLWETGSFADAFGLAPEPSNSGYGHEPADVAAVRPTGEAAVTDYLAAVAARTRAWLPTLHAADLDRVVDEHWDPPVTLGVRLVSVVDDSLQHAGQAAYVRGLLDVATDHAGG